MQAHTKPVLWSLLGTFILSYLTMQGFNLIFQTIGDELGAAEVASLIVSLPSIVLGVVSFLYGALGDFVSLRALYIVGTALTVGGSIGGFFCPAELWWVVFFRCVQMAGGQAAGAIFLVVTARQLADRDKVTFFGLYNGGFYLSVLLGALAGGFLSAIHWRILFLLPAISVVFIPHLLRHLSSERGLPVKVDWLGLSIGAVLVASLTLYFTFFDIAWLIAAAVLAIILGFHIHFAKAPFLTREFLRNPLWLSAMLLLFLFYFNNYSVSPLYDAAGGELYGMTSADVSLMLMPSMALSVVIGALSGRIDERLGRRNTVILASVLLGVGFLASGWLLDAGPVAQALTACLFYAGYGLIYSPLYDTAVDAVKPEEGGRATAINELILAMDGSLGVAILAPYMTATPDAGPNLIGVAGAASGLSSILVIYAVLSFLGLAWYLVRFRARR